MQLLSQIYAAAGGGTLQVQNDSEAATTGPNPTTLKEFTIGDSGGIQNTGTTDGTVPAGSLGVIDAYTSQAATIVGAAQSGETVVAGGGMTFFTHGGSGTVISGQGNNLVASLPTGDGTWTVLFDGGHNTVFATSGNFSIDDGNASTSGSNQIFLGSGGDVVQSWGQDLIVAARGGFALVATFTPGSVFFGNTGQSVFINLGGNDTFVAGRGQDTVFAGASGGLYFGNAGTLVFASDANTAHTVVAGAGSSTIFGNTGGDGLYFVGRGDFLLVGAAENQSVVGGFGSSAAQIFGLNGDNVTLFSPINGNQLIAGPGNVTLNGGGATGKNVYFAGPSASSADSIVAGSDNSTLVAGPGSNTLVGGAGSNKFVVDKGFAGGGNEFIVNWNAHDIVALSGYGAPTAAGGLPAGATNSIVGGSEVLTLADGTTITFVGSNIRNSHIHSS